MPAPVSQTKITVQVQPRASRNEVAGFIDGVLKVKIAAPPVEGKANKKLVEFLSECLGVSKSRLNIVKGEKGRNKVIAIEGLGWEEVVKRLSSL
jgi:uncharacterized protein